MALLVPSALCAAVYYFTYQPYDHLVNTGTVDTSIVQRGMHSRRWAGENLLTMVLCLLHAIAFLGCVVESMPVEALEQLAGFLFFVSGGICCQHAAFLAMPSLTHCPTAPSHSPPLTSLHPSHPSAPSHLPASLPYPTPPLPSLPAPALLLHSLPCPG